MRGLILLLFCTLVVVACGKKGALIYTDLLVPSAVTSINVRQSGPGVKLSFVLPDKDRAGQSLAGLAGVKVFKREATTGQEPVCNACNDDFRLFKKLYLDILDINARRYGNLLILLDNDVNTERVYGYKVIPFMKDDLDGETSNTVTVTMIQPPPPPDIKAVSAPTEMKLQFAVSPGKEEKFMGYNLYRAVKGEVMPYLPINKELITADTFIDNTLKRRVTYIYAARTVVRTPTGALMESALSGEVSGELKDDE